MSTISRVWAREILDSRGVPTIEAACQLATGHIAVASVPSGSSTGSHEAPEVRDFDPNRYKGKGVLKAVNNINAIIGPSVAGFDPQDQTKLDKHIAEMDGTANKSNLGANAVLAVSTAVSKAGAMVANMTLYQWIHKLAEDKGIAVTLRVPTPLFNMINGGLHGAGNLDFQEFFVIPASTKTYSQGLQAAAEIYLSIGENLARRGAIHSVGDEGGYAPNLFTNADALEILVEAIKQSPYAIGRDVFLGLDVAATTFYKDGHYTIRDKSAPLNDDALIDYYKEINDTYRLAVLEDPFFEDAWESWSKIRIALGDQVSIVGDDLLATDLTRVEKAITNNACNAILVKPNQIGTISETLDVIKRSREAGWKVIVSHRSGETNDWFIADFAVGAGADHVKFGAPARGERVAKYNRLSSIEAEITRAQ